VCDKSNQENWGCKRVFARASLLRRRHHFFPTKGGDSGHKRTGAFLIVVGLAGRPTSVPACPRQHLGSSFCGVDKRHIALLAVAIPAASPAPPCTGGGIAAESSGVPRAAGTQGHGTEWEPSQGVRRGTQLRAKDAWKHSVRGWKGVGTSKSA